MNKDRQIFDNFENAENSDIEKIKWVSEFVQNLCLILNMDKKDLFSYFIY
jgi:hypothetical protein